MNLITKRVDEKLAKWKLIKSKKIVLENTKKFAKKFNVNLVYSKIDFLTLRIEKNNFIQDLELSVYKSYSYQDLYDKDIDFNCLYWIKKVLDKFYIIYTGLAFGNQKKVYSVFDFEKNKIWQIVLRNESEIKANKNVVNEIEFKGLFFKCYDDFLDSWLVLLSIEKTKLNIVKRLDFCVDFAWIEVFELLRYIKLLSKKSKVVNALTGLTKKNILDYLAKNQSKSNISDLEKQTWLKIKYWTKETYIKYSSNDNDLKIYDKILDVIDQHKTSKINWVNPYLDYLNSNVPITRIEYKKKNFKNLYDNSLNRLFQNIESLFFDYLLRFFNVDFSFYKWVDITLNWKKSFLAKEKKQKNLYHSMIMAQAYLRNIDDIAWKEVRQRFLLKIFPDMENLNFLDLITSFELQNYFMWFNDTLIDNPEFYDYYKQRKK
jgi:hypothetical protein